MRNVSAGPSIAACRTGGERDMPLRLREIAFLLAHCNSGNSGKSPSNTSGHIYYFLVSAYQEVDGATHSQRRK